MIKLIIPAMAWMSPRSGKRRMVIDAKYAEGKVPNWTRKKRYEDWKRHVQRCAIEARVELPLRPAKSLPFYIVTIAYFETGVHPDPSNVWEGITDALCYVSPQEQKLLGTKRGSDKYTGGLFFAPQYDKECPRVEVTVLTAEEFEGMTTDYYLAVIDKLLEEGTT